MYDENRRFNFTNFFIKMIIVIVFVLFAVWLISLSNKGLSNSLDVLTDDVFSQNIEKMKEVGKSYFTIERLPEKVGEVKTLTLAKMYDEKYILELKDKYGNACSAKNSYVSIEKFDNEYQMKVYLECGEESDYVIVIMGCYDYCDTDICEKKETVSVKEIEYEYKKTTGGKWTDYGKWSDWSKVSVSNTNYRQVETKKENENYSYDKTIVENKEVGNATCPGVSGYKLVSNKNGKCSYSKSTTSTKNPTCPSLSGYTLTNRDKFTCNYSKSSTVTENPICPSLSGYTLTGRNGFTCNYSKVDTSTANPTCPGVSGYTLSGISGFTCNYSKSSTSTANPTCPSLSGYTLTGRNGFTCNYSKNSTSYSWQYYTSGSGSYIPYSTDPNTTDDYYADVTSSDYTYDCSGVCSFKWYYTYKVYKKVANVSTTTKSAVCPSGYSQSGSTCVKSTTSTTTGNAVCPSGYSQSGNTCIKSTTSTTTKSAVCPNGFNNSGNNCTKVVTETTTKSGVCPSGYSKVGNLCSKTTVSTTTKNAVCGVDETIKNGKCYKDVESVVKVNGTREVVYYRYRVREYIGGTVDYKWSKSKNDQKLLDSGYVLTGRTR